MCFVFDIRVYFKLFLHVFTHVNVSDRSVLLFNKLMMMMMMMVFIDEMCRFCEARIGNFTAFEIHLPAMSLSNGQHKSDQTARIKTT